MPILLTGANGFIGRHLQNHLKATGKPYRSWDKTGDTAQFAGAEIVIHAAGLAHRRRINRETYIAVNTKLTEDVYTAAKAAGAKLFIFISSIAVRELETKLATGATNIQQAWQKYPYAMSKLEAEKFLNSQTGLPVIILRPPAVYGEDARGNMALMQKLLRFHIPLPFMNVTGRRAYIYINELVKALAAILNTPHPVPGTYELADATPYSLADFMQRIAFVSDLPQPHLFTLPEFCVQLIGRAIGRRDLSQKMAENLLIDNSKISAAFGWQPSGAASTAPTPVATAPATRQAG